MAPFDAQDASRLAESEVLGSLPRDDGTTPFVDIGVNDATGSKMSYYLRYRASVNARSCTGGRQQLSGRLKVNQTVSPAQAAKLPDSVTGGGNNGTPPGTQAVLFRIYGPHGGSVSDIMIDGARVDAPEGVVRIDGRQVITVYTELSSRDDVVVTWEMESGLNQSGDGAVGLTPSVLPGNSGSSFASAC